MRVVVSGTHGSGKSTLISDFAVAQPAWEVLPDPYELIDLDGDTPSSALFIEQLNIAARRLVEPTSEHVVAERGPLDFLAYLHAMETLGRSPLSSESQERAEELTRRAMAQIDLLVLLPLNRRDAITISVDEDLELRDAMNTALLELSDDAYLVAGAKVVEIVGSRDQRLTQLRDAVQRRASERREL